MSGVFGPQGQKAEGQGALDGNYKVLIYIYEGQGHAFARVGGRHFDKASADSARERTLDHFRVHLG